MKKLFNFKSFTAQNFFSRIVRSVFFLFSILYILSSTYSAFALTTVTTSSAGNVRSGLIGHWTFDGKNMTNATATDIGGGGNNGTLVNMTTASAATRGKIGQALQLNGSNQYITHLPPFQSVNAFSYSIWVKNTNVNADFAGYWEAVSNKQFFFRNSSARFFVRNAADTTEASAGWGSAITDGKWHHVVGVADGTNLQAYLDGVPGTKTALSGPYLQPASIKWQIGNGYQDGLVAGAIDDARAYNRALTASEVQALYKAGGGTIAAVAPGKSSNGSNEVGANNGLVGHWTFDGNYMTNATATDISGNGNNGALTNMTATSSATSGKLGQGLNFNGSSKYIALPGSVRVTSGGSWSAWFKTSTGGNQNIIGKDYASCSGNCNHRIAIISGQVQFFDDTSSVVAYSITSPGTYNDGKWHHVTATWGSGAKLYVDGLLVGTSSSSTSDDTGSYISIGRNNNEGNTATWYFNGSLDDVRIYNRAISTTEIQSLYKAGGGSVAATNPSNTNYTGINSGLVGYWTFDGKNMTNATATDISGSGNNGALTGMTASSNATMGKIGQALNFDAVNDVVSGTSSVSLNLTGALTISAWINPRSSGGSSRGRIFDKNPTGSAGYTFFLDSSNYSATGLSFGVNGATQYTSGLQGVGSVITLNKWQHVVATLSAGQLLRLYVNGVKVTEYAGFDLPVSNSDSFGIGARTSDSTRNFDGKIDEVRVYNRDLTQSEVQTLYRLGSQQ